VEDRVTPGLLDPLVEPVDVFETLDEPDTVAVRYIVRLVLGLFVRDERDVEVRLCGGLRDSLPELVLVFESAGDELCV
jgi:hypothetical protein